MGSGVSSPTDTSTLQVLNSRSSSSMLEPTMMTSSVPAPGLPRSTDNSNKVWKEEKPSSATISFRTYRCGQVYRVIPRTGTNSSNNNKNSPQSDDNSSTNTGDQSPPEEANLIKEQRLAMWDEETLEHRADRYISDVTLSQEQLQNLVEVFMDELRVGLEAHKRHKFEYVPSECSFKMLDACIQKLPTGSESAIVYALDFGGTNFRAVRIQLMKDRPMKITNKKASLADFQDSSRLRKGLLDANASATEMFDFFASVVKSLMIENGDLETDRVVPCGFTFSFPCLQRKIDSADLIVWTKGFETGRNTDDAVEGVDVGRLMNCAFERARLPVRVNSIVNDTVGTMLSCAYSLDKTIHPPCLVGLILGTGFNACYWDERAGEYDYQGSVANIEAGNFNRELPRTVIDLEIDFLDTAQRGQQHLEKMVAGAYLGEYIRRTVIKVFQYRTAPKVWTHHTLSSEHAAQIVDDHTEDLSVVKNLMQDCWCWENTTFSDRKIVQDICTAVYERAAALAAMVIVACVKKTGRFHKGLGGVSVGIDGSLYKCNQFYRDNISKYVNLLVGQQNSQLIHLLLAEDGSGSGAGIVAAVTDETAASDSSSGGPRRHRHHHHHHHHHHSKHTQQQNSNITTTDYS